MFDLAEATPKHTPRHTPRCTSIADETLGQIPYQIHHPDMQMRARSLTLTLALLLWSPPTGGSTPDEVMAAAAAGGLTVGRIWALGEGPAGASDWLRENFLFRAGPEGWIEAPYRQLDRVLVAARRHGVRLIITLSNHWADFGGVPQYLRWAGRWNDRMFGVQGG